MHSEKDCISPRRARSRFHILPTIVASCLTLAGVLLGFLSFAGVGGMSITETVAANPLSISRNPAKLSPPSLTDIAAVQDEILSAARQTRRLPLLNNLLRTPQSFARSSAAASGTSVDAPSTGVWSLVDAPNAAPAEETNYLIRATCLANTDCWAVGYYINDADFAQTLIEHWDGTAWNIVPSPNVDNSSGALFDVACTSGSDCWAVGYYYTGANPQTLIEHWDGTSWNIVTSPNGSSSSLFLGVTCVSASDCWAVGGLLAHWDGSAWNTVSSPTPGTTGADFLYRVTCVSTSDCWAVGSVNEGAAGVILAQHWNGAAWVAVPTPNAADSPNTALTGVTCNSTSDCWAVGYAISASNTSNYESFIQHWDGVAWLSVTLPNPQSTQSNFLEDVACSAASNCWTVGSAALPDGTYQTLIEHWDGSSWNTATSPNTSAVEYNVLFGTTCLSGSDCWALGYTFDGVAFQTLTNHWNGSAWSFVSSADVKPVRGNNFFNGVTCVSTSDCWVVGDILTSAALLSLTEHWDGTQWNVVPAPSVPWTATRQVVFNELFAVACPSSSDCWAVGYYVLSGGPDITLIEHWDGNAWSIVNSPNSSATDSDKLYAVACSSASNCWAVGSIDNGTVKQTLIQHWDGTSWAIVTSPNTSSSEYNELEGLTCNSASDCWAVGYHTVGNTFNDNTLTAHWDGTSWNIESSPSPSSVSNFLFGVSCSSSSSCWGVGWYDPGDGTLPALIEHWDGSAWTMLPAAAPDNSIYYFLFNVACTSSDNCWAVGGANTGSDIYLDRTFVERWDGSSWTVAASPNPVGYYPTLYGLTCATASNCWSIGGYQTLDGVWQNVTMRYLVPPASLVKVVSREAHGSAGTFDVDLTNGSGIECRSGGANGDYTLVFTFANPLSSVVGASVSNGTGTVSSRAIDSNDAHNYIVNLTGITNAQYITVSLTNVTDSIGDFSTSVSATMGALLGDVNASGRTDAGDVTVVRNHTVAVPDQQTFRFDVNASGRIDAGDVTTTRNAIVTVLP